MLHDTIRNDDVERNTSWQCGNNYYWYYYYFCYYYYYYYFFYYYFFLITAIFNLIPSGLGASAEETAVEQFLKDAVSVSDSLVRVVRKADSCKNNAVLKISGIVWTGPLMECGLAGFPRFEK